MGDHFEQALQEIARRRNGGGKTIDDVFDLAVAANQDAEERHVESVRATRENRKLLEVHCKEADERDNRIAALEGWRTTATATCPERVLAIVEKEHAVRHQAHMDDYAHLTPDEMKERHVAYAAALERGEVEDRRHPEFDDEEMGDLRRAWRVVRWALAAFVLPIIAAGGYRVGQLLFN
jgi:hypothetical protein